MKTILYTVSLIALIFTLPASCGRVHAQNTNAAPVEHVTLPQPSVTPYVAVNVPVADLAAKIADAKAQCPAGKTVSGPIVNYNSKSGLFTVTATYR